MGGIWDIAYGLELWTNSEALPCGFRVLLVGQASQLKNPANRFSSARPSQLKIPANRFSSGRPTLQHEHNIVLLPFIVDDSMELT